MSSIIFISNCFLSFFCFLSALDDLEFPDLTLKFVLISSLSVFYNYNLDKSIVPTMFESAGGGGGY